MKKILIALAAVATCVFSAGAIAQPGPGMHQARMAPPHHRKHKVWVPAHREHGRMVRGHYVYR